MATPAIYGMSLLYPTATAATSHAMDLPLYSSGDLLLVLVSTTNAATASISGWTELFAANRVSSAGQDRITCLYRTSDGSEGTSVSISCSASENAAAVGYSISRYSSAAIEYNTATGNSITPDPPSLSPGAGSGEYLWIAAMATTGARYPVSYSSGYQMCPSLLFNAAGTSTARTTLATCANIITSSSEDPGGFGLSASFEWIAATISVPLNVAPSGSTLHPLYATGRK